MGQIRSLLARILLQIASGGHGGRCGEVVIVGKLFVASFLFFLLILLFVLRLVVVSASSILCHSQSGHG